MVTRSSSLLALLIMVMVLALKDCDANQGIKKVVAEARDGVEVPGRNYMNNAMEMFVAPAAEATRGKHGGRKMMAEGREISNELKKEESKRTSATAAATKISGRKDIAKYLKKTPAAGSLMTMDDQDDATNRPVDVPNSGQLCSHKCANGSVSEESDNDSFQKLDSEKLLEAASQTVGLMNKDYPGDGGAGYRTPINNQEPLH